MKLQESLKAFVDGELSISERHMVTKHLETSEEDRKAVEDLNRLSASIREYVTQPEPVGLQATLEALEKAKPKARAQGLLFQQLRWVGGFACAVMLVGVVGSVIFPVFSESKKSALRAVSKPMDFSNGAAAADAPPPNGDVPLTSGDGAMGGAAMHKSAARAKLGPGASDNTKGFSAGEPDSNSGGAGFGGGVNGAITQGQARSSNDELKGSWNDGLKSGGNSSKVASPSSSSQSWMHRALIQKNASLTVKVKQVSEAQHTVESVATGLGGYVEHSSRTEAEGEKGEATLTVRVPVQRYEDALKSIRGLGDVISESNNGNDVTSEIVDMDARLRVLRTEETDYVALLARARSTAGIIEIRDKLTEIREEIESIDGQRKSTKDLATYSTINVQLTQRGEAAKPKPEEGSWLDNTWSTAVDGLGSAGRVVAQLLIFVIVWCPIWVPVALLCAWLYRRIKW